MHYLASRAGTVDQPLPEGESHLARRQKTLKISNR